MAACTQGCPPPPVGLPLAARPKAAGADQQDDEASARWEADVRAMAWYLGMNLVLDEAHMGIAEQALSATVPDGWSEAADSQGRVYYWRTADPRAEAQWEQGNRVRAALAERGFLSVAAEGFAAPGVVVCYTDNGDIQTGKAFAAEGAQIAAGVPLMVGEGDGYRSFRLGLFGLDKLLDVDASVGRLETLLDRVTA